MFGTGEKDEKRRQDQLDSLLKVCLPLIWHHKVKDTNTKEMLPFVPEGYADAANISCTSGIEIKIWKEKNDKNDYELRASIKCPAIKDEYTTKETLSFEEMNKFVEIVRKNSGKVSLKIAGLNAPFNCDFKDPNLSITFDGFFWKLIPKLNSSQIKSLKHLPSEVRFYSRDKYDKLLIHDLIQYKTSDCAEDLVKMFLNQINSKYVSGVYKRNALQYACMTNNLEVVKLVVKFGGLHETKAQNMNTEIKDFLDQERKKQELN